MVVVVWCGVVYVCVCVCVCVVGGVLDISRGGVKT